MPDQLYPVETTGFWIHGNYIRDQRCFFMHITARIIFIYHLRLKFRAEARIGQASDEVHHELGVEIHDLVRHVHGHLLALDDELLLHHGVQHRINVLLHTCCSVTCHGAEVCDETRRKTVSVGCCSRRSFITTALIVWRRGVQKKLKGNA